MDTWFKRIPVLPILVLALLVGPGSADARDEGTALVASLKATDITARDLKTLHYVQNAHGQLDEWSFRLLARLQRGDGPRKRDPVFDGRADLQVKKIAVTYAGYTHSEPLRRTLIALVDAHERRLRALQAMLASEVDAEAFKQLDAPVQELFTALHEWSEQR